MSLDIPHYAILRYVCSLGLNQRILSHPTKISRREMQPVGENQKACTIYRLNTPCCGRLLIQRTAIFAPSGPHCYFNGSAQLQSAFTTKIVRFHPVFTRIPCEFLANSLQIPCKFLILQVSSVQYSTLIPHQGHSYCTVLQGRPYSMHPRTACASRPCICIAQLQ